MADHRIRMRTQYLLIALGSAIGGIFLGLIVYGNRDENPDWPTVLAIICGVTLLFAGWYGYAAWTSHPDEVVDHPDYWTPAEQAEYYPRVFWLGLVAFPALWAWSFYNIYQLETGAVERAELWIPMALAYQFGGSWLALGGLALLFVSVQCGLWYKWQRAERNIRSGR